MTGFDGLIGDGVRAPRLLGEPQDPGRRAPEASGEDPFLDALGGALLDVKHQGDRVKDKYEAFLRGEPVEVHDIYIEMGKAELSFNLLTQVRNQLIEAWQTLSRSVV